MNLSSANKTTANHKSGGFSTFFELPVVQEKKKKKCCKKYKDGKRCKKCPKKEL